MKTIRFLFFVSFLAFFGPSFFTQESSIGSQFALNSEDELNFGFSFSHKLFSSAVYLEKKENQTNFLLEGNTFFFDNWLLKNIYVKIPNEKIDLSFGSLSYSGMIGSFKNPHFATTSSSSLSNISSSQIQSNAANFRSSAQAFSLFLQYKPYESKIFKPKFSFINSDLAPTRYLTKDEKESQNTVIFSHLLLPLSIHKMSFQIGLGHAVYFQNPSQESTWFLTQTKRNEGFYSIFGIDSVFTSPFISLKNSFLLSQREANLWQKANRSELLLKLPSRYFEPKLYTRFFICEPGFITAKSSIEKTQFQAIIKPQIELKGLSIPFIGLSNIQMGLLGEYQKKTESIFPLQEAENIKFQTSFSLKTLKYNFLYAIALAGPLNFLQENNEENTAKIDSWLADWLNSEKLEIKNEIYFGIILFFDNLFIHAKPLSPFTLNITSSFVHKSFPYSSDENDKLSFGGKISLKNKNFLIEENLSIQSTHLQTEIINSKTNLGIYSFNIHFENEYKIISQINKWLFQISYKTKI